MRPDYYPKMWFGTQDKMQWIDTPLSGANIGKESWNASGTFLNGGGYSRNSWDSHNEYHFNWKRTSSRRSAQIMQNYRDGVYGRGLIYFSDPLTFDTNILPKSWAYPGLAAGQMRNPFYKNLIMPPVNTPGNSLDLPVQGLRFSDVTVADLTARKSIFLPTPPGYQAAIKIWATRTGATPQFQSARVLSTGDLSPRADVGMYNPADTSQLGVSLTQSGDRGVVLYFPSHTGAGNFIDFYGARAWLYKTGSSSSLPTPGWFGGQGHSGCRFVGNPTYVEHTGVDGGQIEYSAVLKEVGSWL